MTFIWFFWAFWLLHIFSNIMLLTTLIFASFKIFTDIEIANFLIIFRTITEIAFIWINFCFVTILNFNFFTFIIGKLFIDGFLTLISHWYHIASCYLLTILKMLVISFHFWQCDDIFQWVTKVQQCKFWIFFVACTLFGFLKPC